MPAPDNSALEREQVAQLASMREAREARTLRAALDALRDAAGDYANSRATSRTPLMPLIVDAVRARGTVGEISDCLRERWGTYRPT